MPRVTSSAVLTVDHDPFSFDLVVTYRSGARYAYGGVPAETYRALLAAPSIGAFVNREIKPNHPARALTGRRAPGRRSPA